MGLNLEHPDFLELRNRIREDAKDFVAIVGAGLSIPAGLPNWNKLRDAVAKDAQARISSLPETDQPLMVEELKKITEINDLWQAFSELKRIMDRNSYEKSIKDHLTIKDKKKIPRSYELLWKLDIKGIVTFNLDSFAVDSYSKVKQFAVDVATYKEPSRFKQFIAGTQDFVLYPHGFLSDSSTWIFTEEEKTTLLSKKEYLNFMDTLCRAKNLLVLGFNPEDFAFEYILQHALFNGRDTGSKHYIVLANPDGAVIRKLGNKGVSVIPYSPDDPNLHKEVETLLEAMTDYVPQDIDATSIFSGDIIPITDLPSDEELQRKPIEVIRNLLNGAILGILPPGKEAVKEDYDTLELFYKDYLWALTKAWIVEPKSKSDILYGHRILSTIGRGAFGQVYEALNTSTGETVAVKVLLPDVRSDQDYLRSFRRGIHSMRILTDRKCEGMVKFISAYEIPACVFMEYINGPNLTEAMNNRILDNLTSCLEALIQIGDIVHRAHNLDERVLHRDLKPANIILKDYYLEEQINVVVLDFDLSWHKGALDLSVVHGARAQGYAAPEQTATGRKKGISTRSTAVDVFGYGMLAYYLLVGDDPRPNEQNFEGFMEKVKSSIHKRFRPEWSCLPSYFAEIIRGCTADEQSDRIPFSSAIEAFSDSLEMARNNTIDGHSPLVLFEIASRVDQEEQIQRTDFGRHVKGTSLDGSKEVELYLKNDVNENFFMEIKIVKMRTGFDARFVTEYIEKARDKAMSLLKKSGKFKTLHNDISMSRLDISAVWGIPSQVSLDEIIEVARVISEARSLLELK
jgi:eukaryotic-like serine/threonine-protein kinase